MAIKGPSAAEDALPELRRATDDGAGQGPFAAGEWFEQFPGPVLVVGRNGLVLSANRLADPLTQLLRSGTTSELRDAVDSALAGKVAQVTPLLLEGRGQSVDMGRAYDFVALPWAEGAAALLMARDITLERGLRSALIDSRQRYKDLVEASSDFAWETDREGRFAFVSPGGALGHAASEMVGRLAGDFLIDGGGPGASPFTTRAPVDRVEVRFCDSRGRASCLSATSLPLRGPDGSWRGARGTCRDITRDRQREAALARAGYRQRLLAYLLKMIREGADPALVLKAVAEALLPAMAASGVAVYRRALGDALVRVAEVGVLPPEDRLTPALACVVEGRPVAEHRSAAGVLWVRRTGYRTGWNGALCLWRDTADEAWSDEETMLLGEVAEQIGMANERLAREAESGPSA